MLSSGLLSLYLFLVRKSRYDDSLYAWYAGLNVEGLLLNIMASREGLEEVSRDDAVAELGVEEGERSFSGLLRFTAMFVIYV